LRLAVAVGVPGLIVGFSLENQYSTAVPLPGVVLVEVVLIFVADAGVAELPDSAGAFAGICGD